MVVFLWSSTPALIVCTMLQCISVLCMCNDMEPDGGFLMEPKIQHKLLVHCYMVHVVYADVGVHKKPTVGLHIIYICMYLSLCMLPETLLRTLFVKSFMPLCWF